MAPGSGASLIQHHPAPQEAAWRSGLAIEPANMHASVFDAYGSSRDPDSVGREHSTRFRTLRVPILALCPGRSYGEVVIHRRGLPPGVGPHPGRYPMTTSISSSAALAVIEPAFSEAEKLALTGFLAGYSGMTGEAYALDLRQVTAWCRQRQRRLFAVRCADIEQFARDLEAAGLGTAAEHALVSLLALNGLRVSEATGANIEALGTERGHRNLAITRKGGNKAIIPLAPVTARAIDLAIGERCQGPIFTTATGQKLDRHGAGRIVRPVGRRAGPTKQIRLGSSTPPLPGQDQPLTHEWI